MDQVNDFRLRGYIVIGKLRDDKLIEILRGEYDRLFAEARQSGHYRNLAIGDADSSEEKKNASK